MNDTFLSIGPQWLPLVSAIVVPFLTALVTRFRGDNTRVHAIVAIFLSAVLATIAALTDDVRQDTLWSLFLVFCLAFGPTLLSYLGVYQPLTQGRLNAKLAPTKGI